jgi:hypothetical protein
VHLGDAEAGGDLRLGQALEKSQVDDQLLAGRQLRQHRRQRRPPLGVVELGVVRAEARAERLTIGIAAGRGVV